MDAQRLGAGAVVVKLGGSLYDLPDLGPRLCRCLTGLNLREVMLVPGGGRTADEVRNLDRCHHLGEDAAHWLALRALTLNAHFLAALLPNAAVVAGWDLAGTVWRHGGLPVLDAFAFAAADEGRPGALPHCWDVTSDSIAARFAAVGGARRLVLLKSVEVPAGLDWEAAGQRGLVDPFFARVLPPNSQVTAINLRAIEA